MLSFHVTLNLCVCLCSVLFRQRLLLRGSALPAVPADDGQRVGLGVEHPVVQREEVVVGEEQVQIPADRRREPLVPEESVQPVAAGYSASRGSPTLWDSLLNHCNTESQDCYNELLNCEDFALSM